MTIKNVDYFLGSKQTGIYFFFSNISMLIETFIQTLKLADAQDGEILTIYTGKDMTEDDLESMESDLRHTFSELELDIVDGGQPLYPFVASLE